MKILIKTMGFIGDNIFASSIAKKLKEQYGNDCVVDFQLSILSPFELISNNPHIDNVYMEIDDELQYDIIYSLNPIHRSETPTIQLQKQCGIKNPSSEYEVYTNKTLDYLVNRFLKKYRDEKKVLVAYQSNWEEKTFSFTEEEYKKGINIPPFGYGGKRRDIQKILKTLNHYDELVLIPVGKPDGFNQKSDEIGLVSELTLTASVIKNCDCFIGSEGGLSNIAAGLGVKTIITGDFVHQLYGWNGVMEKNEEPKLGPKFYFPEFGHVTLDPYITDQEVADSIAKDLVCDCNFK
jgi:hypothetical protein